jgi:cytochrome c556
MTQRRQWRRSVVVVGSLAVFAVAACATTEQPRMSAADAIAARQKLMKEQGAAMRSIQDKIKTGQVQGVAEDAEKLAKTADQITPLFPPGSVNPETSRAKPEIWKDWPKFEGYAKALDTKAVQLAATARGGNAQATGAAATDLGKTTCGACHNEFRGPEIKK